MEGSIIDQGIELMLFGMGTVIVFLTLLVFATGWMTGLVRRWAPELPEAAADDSAQVSDPTLLAIISAAIHQHRSRR